MDLKVGIDARYLENPTSGIERYTLNLLRGIVAAGPPFRVVALVTGRTDIPQDLGQSPSLEFIAGPSRPRRLTDQLMLPVTIAQFGLRLFHHPDCFGPLAAGCRKVITIHDMIGITCRHLLTASLKSRWFRAWRAWLAVQSRTAAAIVTVSQYSAWDIHRILRVPRRKIQVIANAVQPASPGPERAPEDFLTRLGISGRILLCVGRPDPYKNLVGLVRAMTLVRQGHSEPVCLVIAGERDARYRQAEDESRRLGLADSVHFVGYLSDAELDRCYQAASLFVFPSLYEGFGLPPLEAMAFGVPVVSSNRTAMPEVLGGAALYVDPEDPQAMAEGIRKVLNDETLAGQLRAAGKKRVREFSVLDMGIRHLELYERLLA